jgi:hypothetical protein
MGSQIKLKLEKMRIDYYRVSGKVFSHFFCPILYSDEPVELCKAHIVNVAFPNSSPIWTIQRKDVDSFYGSNFEADFVTLKYRGESIVEKAITDRNIFNKFNPKLLLDDKPIDFFVTQDNVPSFFTKIAFDNNNELTTLGLKMHPNDFLSKVEHKWDVEISKDVRIPALVSLIKSAHLTMFEMLGYNYALSAGGYFVGKQILGNFFMQNQGKSKSDVANNAFPYFREFTHMVRPLQQNNPNFKGTITDGNLLLCKSSNGTYWAAIVFIKASESLHAVLIPLFSEIEAVATFMEFINNNHDEVNVNFCKFEKNLWRIDKSANTLTWPKDGTLYPENIDIK